MAEKCATVICTNDATVRAHLPMGPYDYCDACCQRALDIYGALGCHVHIEPITPAPQEGA